MPCAQAKEFLREQGVEFESVDIHDLAEPFETIREHTGGPVGTPTVVIGDDAKVGFDPDWILDRLQQGVM